MAAPKRTKIQRERDLVIVAGLYLKGYDQRHIAIVVSEEYADFTICRQQVGYDIKKLIERWRRSQLVDVDDAKTSELAKINNLELTYWNAWERSCENAETVQQKGGAEGVDQITKTSKGQAGDPRFLVGVQWCIERRCKILGVDAPIEQKHTGTGEKGEMLFRYVDNLGPDVI